MNLTVVGIPTAQPEAGCVWLTADLLLIDLTPLGQHEPNRTVSEHSAGLVENLLKVAPSNNGSEKR
jgi:hypothetical protein